MPAGIVRAAAPQERIIDRDNESVGPALYTELGQPDDVERPPAQDKHIARERRDDAL
jgi:hypothetical protein